MAQKELTTYQRLQAMFSGGNTQQHLQHVNSYDLMKKSESDLVYHASSKEEAEMKKLELAQDKFLARAWQKATYDLTTNELNSLALLQLMYKDADLMDTFPEINAALHLVSEEATTVNLEGKVLNIESSSPRIKSVLDDLFVTRLNINTMSTRIIRGMLKYGNQYHILKLSSENGVEDWKELPVYEIERHEDGYAKDWYTPLAVDSEKKPAGTRFIWNGSQSGERVYQSFQIAHFRLLNDSIFLPYGQSFLNGARRHFRMLYMMEDSMLIYRLDRSIERRVFKVFVGNIDDKDVQSYVDTVVNQTKRGSLIDPQTGMFDIRKNWSTVVDDYYIPVRDMNAPNPIETLSAAQNLTAIDDIKFIQNKVFTALRVPKPFISFEESAGDGKNLAMYDVRLARTVNRIQMAFIEELTRIAEIHLFLLGFKDELTNFSISMNNPSSQAEQLAIELLSKKLSFVRDAVSDPGNGLQPLSMQRALKMAFHMSEAEIKENWNEIRLETALKDELTKTSQIIKRTGVFNEVDRLYGQAGAEYTETEDGGDMGDGGHPGGGGGGGMSLGGGFGDELDTLSGDNGEGDIKGEEGEAPINQTEPSSIAGGEANQQEGSTENAGNNRPNIPMESKTRKKGELLREKRESVNNGATDRVYKVNAAFTEMITALDKAIL